MRILLLTLIAAYLAPPAAAEIAWRSDLKSARGEAQQTGKPMLLHFYRDQCVYCERLEQGVYQDPQVQQMVNQMFVPLKVHAPSMQTVAESFKIDRFPTDVIVQVDGNNGNILSREVSPQMTADYLDMLQKPWLANQLAENNPQPQSYQLPQSYQQPTPADATVADATVADGAQFPAGTQADLAGTRLNSAWPTVSQPMQTSQVTAQPKTPLLDGFCPVAMVEQEAWVAGDSKLGVIHLGELYLFSTPQAQQTFLQDPDRFAPVLNGIDSVKFMDERKIVPGRREFGFFDPTTNRIFLFSCEETANRFYNNFDRYANPAIEVMRQAAADANPRR